MSLSPEALYRVESESLCSAATGSLRSGWAQARQALSPARKSYPALWNTVVDECFFLPLQRCCAERGARMTRSPGRR